MATSLSSHAILHPFTPYLVQSLFFYINAERTAVLVHAVTKKRGKLPPSEFDVAEGRIP
jgi:hypothetical protein